MSILNLFPIFLSLVHHFVHHKFLRRTKKRAVKTALFEYLIGLGLLHSHSFSVITHLFNFFITNFIAESDETRRVREGDFVFEKIIK